jgi:tRNA modification GTPase
MTLYLNKDTICAISSGGGMSAIALIRLSGDKSINVINKIFSKKINPEDSHSVHFGIIKENNNILDEVVVTVFAKNKSFTREETVEISCHGSEFIQKKILELLITQGVRIANPGEFTMRAFQNGKIDLSQAESIADLIESDHHASHKNAIQQLRGGFKKKLENLRTNLIDFASLIELELDFSEEDVEFANRDKLKELLTNIKYEVTNLITSFKLGNVIKNGIPVAIIGSPNVGKSTLLNTLLNDEKAIVSDIAGTTRDAIEDELIIEGQKFRFIDTAGLRETNDKIEKIGIKKSIQKVSESKIIIHLIDGTKNINQQIKNIDNLNFNNNEIVIRVINKEDLKEKNIIEDNDYLHISALKNTGIDKLKNKLISFYKSQKSSNNDTIITNVRHYNELKNTLTEINEIIEGLKNNTSSDFLTINIRQALFHLGSITGEVNTDDLLANIFGKFCIGK